MNTKKIIKAVGFSLLAVVLLFALIVGGYVGYVAIQYYRIEDNLALTVDNSPTSCVQTDTQYTVVTYNLGFGAYSPEYSFFMDTGVMDDGTEVAGIYAKGMSKEDVQKNVNGQIGVAKNLEADFYLFQEVDEKADRSYKINMCESLRGNLAQYGSVYAENFHTANLFYPFNDPIGVTNAGIMTFSRYGVSGSVRRSFPVTSAFIDKLFDLDRCFSISYLPVGSGEVKLALINLHMSAYDKGGLIRAEQLKMLNGVLAEERAKGNYVVAGGDFNHCLIADNFDSDGEALSYFESRQKTPDWVKNSVLRQDEIAEGFKLVASMNEATCRGADIPYEKGVNYVTVIDGFIVSDNVEVISNATVDTQYAYSDHNPVKLCFKLK